ncbi:hypothetical protein DFH08DRAFT_937483 [Mycena albidolilacea]|uniref:Uncharacterized protein n=1 Tax=Mycena albidolilacea TaxID=1033008 RepID=A0AAD7EQC5_9AGAR|nr:hypothetical protein DFH08DRAFT_937483 [Mycena albidolilacea]
MLELEAQQRKRKVNAARASGELPYAPAQTKQIQPEVPIGAGELNPIPPRIQQLEQIWPCDAHQIKVEEVTAQGKEWRISLGFAKVVGGSTFVTPSGEIHQAQLQQSISQEIPKDREAEVLKVASLKRVMEVRSKEAVLSLVSFKITSAINDSIMLLFSSVVSWSQTREKCFEVRTLEHTQRRQSAVYSLSAVVSWALSQSTIAQTNWSERTSPGLRSIWHLSSVQAPHV